MNDFFHSKFFNRAILIIILLFVACVSFVAGAFVGYHKARFSYAWGENYDRNFGGPRHGIFGLHSPIFPPEREFTYSHGIFGPVLSVNAASSTLTVEGADNIEKIVLISSSTIFRNGRDAIDFSAIEMKDSVLVIGNPNDRGQIEARLVRILK